MPLIQQITILVISITLIGIVWMLIHYGKLRPAYALIWMVATTVFFIFTLFERIVHLIAGFFNVSYAPSLIFGLALLFCVILLLNQSILISTLSRNNKDLAQTIAILQWRIENLNRSQEGVEPTE